MSDSTSVDPKRILLDLAKEIDGEGLDEIFDIDNFKFRIRMLNEEETSWAYGFVNPTNVVTIATSIRLPTMSMAIREINGMPTDKFFESDWDNLDEVSRSAYESKNKYAKKYFVAEHLMEFLSQRQPDFMHSLWKRYEVLENRRKDLQEKIKNSSGEDSDKTEKKNSTESSPIGE